MNTQSVNPACHSENVAFEMFGKLYQNIDCNSQQILAHIELNTFSL
jgi:hypothetical protein